MGLSTSVGLHLDGLTGKPTEPCLIGIISLGLIVIPNIGAILYAREYDASENRGCFGTEEILWHGPGNY